MDIDIKELEAFACVVEKGSFSRAAEALYLTQPTISAHVASLERKLGIKLLVRTTKEIYPSDAGNLLYEYAKEILRLRTSAVQAIKAFSKEAERMFSSDPLTSDEYPRIVNEKHFDRISGLISGSTVAYGGRMDRDSMRISPTLLYPASPDDPAMQEEIFGPVLPIIEYDTLDEALDFIRDREKPLAFYIFSRDRKSIRKALSLVSFGGCSVNDTVVHLTAPELPFGGIGNSGMGCYHGKRSFAAFTHDKAVMDKDIYFGALMVLFLLPGMPSIYYGDEIGLDGEMGSVEGARYPMCWDEGKWDLDMLGMYRSLAEVRKLPFLAYSAFQAEAIDNDAFTIKRIGRDEAVVAIINRCPRRRSVTLDGFALPAGHVSVLAGEGSARMSSGMIEAGLEAGKSVLFRIGPSDAVAKA